MTIRVQAGGGFVEGLAQLVDPVWRHVRPATPLTRMLRDYPPYRVPHPGDPYRLTATQQQENLDDFLQSRAGRLDRIVQLLAAFGMDASPVLRADGDASSFFHELNAWARREWPKIPRIGEMTRPDRVDATGYDADERPLSMLMDVATLLGEYVVRRRPDYAWALDDDKSSKRRKTTTWGRVLVYRPPDPARGWPSQAFDIVRIVAFECHQFHSCRFMKAALPARGIHQASLDYAEGRHDPLD